MKNLEISMNEQGQITIDGVVSYEATAKYYKKQEKLHGITAEQKKACMDKLTEIKENWTNVNLQNYAAGMMNALKIMGVSQEMRTEILVETKVV